MNIKVSCKRWHMARSSIWRFRAWAKSARLYEIKMRRETTWRTWAAGIKDSALRGQRRRGTLASGVLEYQLSTHTRGAGKSEGRRDALRPERNSVLPKPSLRVSESSPHTSHFG